jgi:hypothetical protein
MVTKHHGGACKWENTTAVYAYFVFVGINSITIAKREVFRRCGLVKSGDPGGQEVRSKKGSETCLHLPRPLTLVSGRPNSCMHGGRVLRANIYLRISYISPCYN